MSLDLTLSTYMLVDTPKMEFHGLILSNYLSLLQNETIPF